MKTGSLPLGNQCRIVAVDKETISQLVGGRNIIIPRPFQQRGVKYEPVATGPENNPEMYESLIPAAVELKIDAVEANKAVELALEAGNMIVSYLRFIDYLNYNWTDECLSIRLPGFVPSAENFRFLVSDPDGTWLWQGKNEEQAKLTIDAGIIQNMKESGLDKFIFLLSQLVTSNLNEMQQAILRALYLFGQSRTELDEADRFLKLMLSAECLLTTASPELAAMPFNQALAFILGSNTPERIELERYFQRLWAQKMQIIREGTSAVHIVSLFDLEYYAAELVKTFLTQDEWFLIRSKTDLQGKFNLLKYAY